MFQSHRVPKTTQIQVEKKENLSLTWMMKQPLTTDQTIDLGIRSTAVFEVSESKLNRKDPSLTAAAGLQSGLRVGSLSWSPLTFAHGLPMPLPPP